MPMNGSPMTFTVFSAGSFRLRRIRDFFFQFGNTLAFEGAPGNPSKDAKKGTAYFTPADPDRQTKNPYPGTRVPGYPGYLYPGTPGTRDLLPAYRYPRMRFQMAVGGSQIYPQTGE
eukprot:2095264-Rhodomonas_salina.1